MNLDKYAPKIAADIARALVDLALAKGYAISVNDGEEWTVKRGRDRQMVLEALATTDADTLVFRREDGSRVGFVWLIWQNGADVASDWSANEDTDALVMPVLCGLGVL